MVKVGLTGGIGSGKTTVAGVWKSLGAQVLNADDLAKKLMAEDAELKQAITEAFGEKAYTAGGQLNRAFLAEEAFAKGRVEELNRLVHPRVRQKTDAIMGQAEKNGCKIFVYEAALLLQNLRPDNIDFVVLVLADKDKRLERVQQRDNSPRQSVLERMEKQQDFNKLADQADIIIRNNGTLEELKSRASGVYARFTEKKPAKT